MQNVSRDAIDKTFSVKMLTKFLILKKIKDFPFTYYGQFLPSFVDDLACFTKKDLGVLLHFRCLEAVFFALKESGWLISLRKSTVANPKSANQSSGQTNQMGFFRPTARI